MTITNQPPEDATSDRALGVPIGLALAAAALSFFQVPIVLDDGRVGVGWIFSDLKWFLLAIICVCWAGALLLGVSRTKASPMFRADGVFIVLVALLVLFWFSLLWAPDVQSGVASAFKATLMFTLLVLIRLTEPRAFSRLIRAFVLASSAGIIVLWFVPLPPAGLAGLLDYRLRSHGGFGNENLLAEFELCLAALSASIGLIERSRLRWVFLIAALVSAGHVFGGSPTNLKFVALAGATLSAVVVFVPMREGIKLWVLIGGLALSVTLAIAIPVYVPDLLVGLPASFAERAQIWANTLHLIAEHPFFGAGAGGFFYSYPQFLEADVLLAGGSPVSSYSLFTRLPPTAENDFLQIGAELGLAGLIMAVAGIYVAGKRILADRDRRWLLVPLGTLFSVSIVSFPLQNPGTLLILVLVLGMASTGLAATPVSDAFGRNGKWMLIVPLAVAVAAVHLFVLQVLATKSEAMAAVYELAGQPKDSAVAATKALEFSKSNPAIRRQAFTRAIVNGIGVDPSLFRKDEILRLHDLARSAGPYTPLVLDLWGKYLLSQPTLEIDQLRQTLTMLHVSSGKTSPNAHILTAALALALGDASGARGALETARELLNDPQTNQDNLENIERLESRARN